MLILCQLLGKLAELSGSTKSSLKAALTRSSALPTFLPLIVVVLQLTIDLLPPPSSRKNAKSYQSTISMTVFEGIAHTDLPFNEGPLV